MTVSETLKKRQKLTKKIEPFWTILIVPTWQEIAFRYLPFKYIYLQYQSFWLVGLVSSLLFAFLTHLHLGKKFMIYAFFGGMVLWWVIVNYGLLAAIMVHSAANIVDLGFDLRKKVLKVND